VPLTFAHPAVPLARLGLPLSALVVGSMAPDFVYSLRLAPRGSFGHTLPGLVLFCLPAGLAVLWAFHRLMKRPLLALGPPPLQRRLAPLPAPFRFLPARRLALVVAGVLMLQRRGIAVPPFYAPGELPVAIPPLPEEGAEAEGA
jgi:hypothetical protein